MAAVELPRPGVEVVQEFRTQSPTVVTPTLPPCPVGVAKEVMEILEADGAGGTSLNANALISLPAFFIAKAATGSPAKYSITDGEQLVFSVNNGPPISVTFEDPSAGGLTPATVVSQVTKALNTAAVTTVLAELVGTTQWRLRTVGVGEFQTIYIDPTTDTSVNTAFELGLGKTYSGLGNYNNLEVSIPPQAFPDPRGNLSELGIQFDTVRVFLAVSGAGTTLKEPKRTESFLRNGDVNGYATTTEGSADLTAPLVMASETLTLFLNGSATATSILFGTESGAVAILAVVNAILVPLGFTATVGGSNGIVITSNNAGPNYSIQVAATGGGQAKLGMTVETVAGYRIEAVDDGNGDAVTSLLEFDSYNFTAAATAAEVTGSAATTTPSAGETLILSDGGQPQTVVFAGTETTAALMATAINAIVSPSAGGKITASDSAGALKLTHSDSGDESVIKVLGGTALGSVDPGVTPTIFAGAEVRGTPFPVLAGDELYLDGVFYASVSQVAPGGLTSRLRIDRYVPISTDVGRRFWVQAKNLPAANRPTPDLVVDSSGNVTIKHSVLRDTTGAAVTVKAPLYLIYTAVRRDVTSSAANPGLLKFSDTATLEAALNPISTDNPLGLALFFALLNATGAEVMGLGVDEVTDDAPYGTVEAYTRAAEYLEAFEVYALAPLTHDSTVAQVFLSHVTFMSEPENKGERIVLFNPEVPTNYLDTLVASGTNGDALSTTTFDTKVASLAALVQNAGVSPIGTIPVSEGLYLDIADDDKKYSIKEISGAQITLRTTPADFASGENDDDYYAETPLTLPIISTTFSIKVRGAELVTSTGQPDKTAIASTVQLMGQSFKNRRFWMTFPDKCAATLGGVEQIIEGFYMNAGIVGMIARQPPQQSFTNFPMTGYTRVLGSNDTYSERQLNVMAAGGAYIVIQVGQGTPLFSRMALTTDMTSIETRTDSITKVVDFTAKFLRRSLQSFIGRFNISQGFLDSLGSVIQGVLGFLVESGVLIGGTLNNIIQDEDAPDTVLIDITLDVPYPCNYIRLTLVV